MIANYHTHTWRCNHAAGREEDYVKCALQRGLQILGFSDHSPYLFPGSYYSHFRMKPEQLKGYCSRVLSLREQYAGQLEIPLGLETEFYPDLFGKTLSFLKDSPVEYLLLGQHFVGNEMGEHYSGSPTADDHILKRYCAQSMDAMQTGLFSYFAHPDLINFRGSRSVYEEQMRILCREAKSCSLPLEMNLLGLREGRNYPAKRFWEIAAEEGCTAILGCDTHDSRHLLETKTEREAKKIAQKLGLRLAETVELRRI